MVAIFIRQARENMAKLTKMNQKSERKSRSIRDTNTTSRALQEIVP